MHRHFLTHVAVNAGQLCCSRLSPGVSFCIWFTAWPSTNHLPLGSRHAVWNRVNSIAPHYPVLTDPWKRLPCQESLREFEGAGWHSLGWVWQWEVKHGILYIVGGTVIKKTNQQAPSSVWLKMKKYLQFLNIYSICFGYNLLRLLKVKPKEVIRISCRWSSVMFCKMKFISSTWNHTPQPVHCMNRSCNRN